ncbi:MAG: sulfotransferase domain-containing protein, partial [Candidatus Electrothrix sp. AUS1_2]|nr:sulfotransferase domain-containing protein [Candidatus Electrothrix sp. AUS1_2]
MKKQTVNDLIKKRELRNRMMDSSIWNDFDFRNDDIIIASYPKSGTTWMQQIVGQLLLNGKEFDLKKISFWLDRNPDQRKKLEVLNMQTHRRFIQTHLPADALVFSPTAKYLYIVRDGRDIILSYHHFVLNLDEQFFTLINSNPGYEDYP